MNKSNSKNILTSLLDNDLFMKWVMNPTPELDVFWAEEANRSDEFKHYIYTLKDLIKNIKIIEPTLSPDEKKLILSKIRHDISSLKVNEKNTKKRWMQVASAVAAALVGIFAGCYLLFYSDKAEITVDYASMLDSIQTVQSGNISLILSNNKVVDIQKDSSQVVYDNRGRVNVDSEEIDGEDDKPSLNQLIVPYGKSTSLTLSDGTKIWVNAGTKLIYPSVFTEKKREIYLIGEVYLDVIKDKNRPFVIKTSQMDVNVLGTQLNISAYNGQDKQSVVLVSGAVNIKSNKLKGLYTLYPNQMFSYEIDSNKAGIEKVDVSNYVSWIHGYLMLKNENLDQLLQKLERYFNLTFIYDAKQFSNINVSGKLDLKGTPISILKYIAITTPISYTINDDKIEIKIVNHKVTP